MTHSQKMGKMGILVDSTGWLFHPLFPGRIGIWICWFLWREENQSTQRKTLETGTRTNNKLNPHMTLRPGIEPGPHWWEASALTTALSLLPCNTRFENEPNFKWTKLAHLYGLKNGFFGSYQVDSVGQLSIFL